MWRQGDEVVLVLPLQPRYTTADPRVDAARGTVALEYGPLVYCLEAVDNPGHRLDDITIDTATTPEVVPAEGLLAGVASIRTTGQVRARPNSLWWPYRPSGGPAAETGGTSRPHRGSVLHLGKSWAGRYAGLGTGESHS